MDQTFCYSILKSIGQTMTIFFSSWFLIIYISVSVNQGVISILLLLSMVVWP
jgi:tetrahydromethanopterin S-methyltransferase subunit E